MYKLEYVMIGKGKQSVLRIGRQYFKLDEPIDAIYHGSKGYVIGNDEESCLAQVRLKVKRKYEGFKVLSYNEVK
jgi:hypothetical protein